MEENTRNIQQNSPAQGNTNDNKIQPDAPSMNDAAANVASNNLMQGTAGTELSPEYGDAADPTSEQLGLHHRDE